MSRTGIVILAAAGLAASLGAAQAAGPPANLCQELVAFVHPKAPDAPPAGAPQPATAAVQAPDKGAAQQPSAGAGEVQQKSGLSGPVAQTGPGASGPQGQAQAQSQAAPAPAGAPAQKKPSPEQIAQVDAAAAANDVQACRAAAQSIRRAGVVMPAPLIALSALDPRFFAAQ
ncbi:hypothetical protein [Methylobacterium platani]|uniref:Uncharacterized protein n=2 Tax=Methylobacterium platani TaxID=427683 RepID=A0A179SG29_9HYPH|nr:hypothetical protein [Methylobacterium platani]KMO12666.1 hypothetical protein SQ03_23880 [Methylobacterium platani JCM 14648]OAS26555.1 hypothetical protein A5481_05770 [Methylobacterium platani]